MTAIPSSVDLGSSNPITLFTQGNPSAISIPQTANSFRGFRDWALSEDFPQRGRYSFINNGLIVDMSPEYFETHNAIKVEVTSTIHGIVKSRQLGYVFADRSLLSNETAEISTEPDAMFVSRVSFRSKRCQIVDSPRPGVAQELIGSPDWVLEIVSTTSIRKDTKLLRDAYFRAGIGEYWLIDALGDEISFQILVPGKDGYESMPDKNGWFPSPTFGASVRLSREADQDGFWQYTLHVQEKS